MLFVSISFALANQRELRGLTKSLQVQGIPDVARIFRGHGL